MLYATFVPIAVTTVCCDTSSFKHKLQETCYTKQCMKTCCSFGVNTELSSTVHVLLMMTVAMENIL